MHPDGKLADMHGERVPIPWWRLMTMTLLAVALGLAVASGHTGDAIIVGVLLLVTVLLVGVTLFFRFKA